ncbi:hypothetical protein [Novosphingobium sp.]|uniref:hypothetical protein n=1 Tax=Novosphingobium sp. TaxID=1874826 RepID=UPI001D3B8032|nr:hypothetical protein [Novosphingobium sp.]MBX9663106.1 hypothetical protein [Novosphingobium sp.]
MKARWWKRLWLRYLYYCKEHWIIAGTLTLWALWLLVQVGIQLLPVVLEFLFELVMLLIVAA